METFFNVSEQTTLFLWACVLGFGLGIIYDVFRVARILVKHGKVAVFIEDVAFTLIFTMSIFIYSTELGRGQIRLFVIVGASLGFVIYLSTVGLLIVTIMRKTVNLIRKILKFLYRHIFSHIIRAVVDICQKIKAPFVNIYSSLKKNIFSSKKDLKDEQALVYNYHTQADNRQNRGDINHGSRKNKRSRKQKKEKKVNTNFI